MYEVRSKIDANSSSSSVEGPTKAQEGSFERPESNKQAEISKPPRVFLWRPYRKTWKRYTFSDPLPLPIMVL